jgi:conjugative transposon TraJ protein
MRSHIFKVVAMTILAIALPILSWAQGLGGDIRSLQSVLDQLYTEMIPLCSQLISVGRGLAGFAALWYIGSRVWRHLANAEPIDFYPLLRPFALGFCIMIFPMVIALINGIMRPTVIGTSAMVSNTNQAIAYLLQKKEEAIQKTPAWQMYVGIDGSGNYEKWYQYTHPNGDDDSWLGGLGEDIRFHMAKAAYSFRNSIKQWMSEILHILFEAAALCINTIRTFYLIVLAILGPFALGLSVFDGFQHTLRVWLARYIHVFLWLPVANIFGAIIGKIQENMLRIDVAQVEEYGDTFFSSSDTAYLVFMVIGIVGYFTVPSITNYIVQAGGAGNILMHKTTALITGSAHNTATTVAAGATTIANAAASYYQSRKGGDQTDSNHTAKNNDHYMRDKLSGNH